MNMFPLILHIVMLEREIETQSQKYGSKSDVVNIAEPARRSSRKRLRWFFSWVRRRQPCESS